MFNETEKSQQIIKDNNLTNYFFNNYFYNEDCEVFFEDCLITNFHYKL